MSGFTHTRVRRRATLLRDNCQGFELLTAAGRCCVALFSVFRLLLTSDRVTLTGKTTHTCVVTLESARSSWCFFAFFSLHFYLLKYFTLFSICVQYVFFTGICVLTDTFCFLCDCVCVGNVCSTWSPRQLFCWFNHLICFSLIFFFSIPSTGTIKVCRVVSCHDCIMSCGVMSYPAVSYHILS